MISKRLRKKLKRIITSSTMLCCGRRKENREVGERQAEVSRRPRVPHGGRVPEMVIQSDFRKVSGITSEVFRQIEAVENGLDPASLEGFERRGDMIIRQLDPNSLGRSGAQACRRYLNAADSSHTVQFVEIIKRPGQTLGLYIREGDGLRTTNGVHISRIALESAVYNSRLLKVGDEILAVNLVDVRRMSLDDVVIIMSIPRRLVLVLKSRISGRPLLSLPRKVPPQEIRPPIVVVKKEYVEEFGDENNGDENGILLHARTKGLPAEIPRVAVPLDVVTPSSAHHQTLPRKSERPITKAPRPHTRYPRTLESLAEQVHTFTAGAQEPQPLYAPSTSFYPKSERTSSARHRYWDEHGSSLRRSARLLRTESEYSPDAYHHHHSRYSSTRPPFRGSTMQQAAAGGGGTGAYTRGVRVRRCDGILRRRPVLESASDTEVGPMTNYHQQQQQQQQLGSVWPRPSQAKSNSLPRLRQRQAVRFDTAADSQEDSDGALSAPEVFTAAEYRAWRAPSTSAIYDRIHQRSLGYAQPRVAFSAESLLDTIRHEEQRSIYTSDMVPTRSSLPLTQGDLLRPPLRPSVPHPTPIKPSQDRFRLLTLNPREFFKYRSEKETELLLRREGFSGVLWVHLLAGRGLRPTTSSEQFRDLYCVIECDKTHKARTVVRPGDHSFDWDEVFELDLIDTAEVAFLVYSWDPRRRHKLCYRGSVRLLTLLRESPVHSLALKLEPRGSLYLKLRYRDPRIIFQRLRAPAAIGLFGVDLETICSKEDSGFGVPLIFKRTIEEIERRGLSVVGIYRLCGSAARKKTLREDFERNALLADLSPEHVPDINVVTSLLKDYLRELPDPLFSRSVFGMLVDGLSVCLPEDPEGNAKLMFSIFDTLPKVHRSAVLYLLDHLKLVTTHSDRNKMTPHHLAVCFGPLVMCHSEQIDVHQPIQLFTFLLTLWPAKRGDLGNSGNGSKWEVSLC